jgi:hypothetical protein
MGDSNFTRDGSSDERRRRAEERRANMTVRRTSLEAGEEDLSPVFGEDAISLLTRLSRESFQMTGADVPTYARDAIPCVFVRGQRG